MSIPLPSGPSPHTSTQPPTGRPAATPVRPLAQTEPPAPTPPPVVIPEPNSRLGQLTAEWATVKPQLDELAKREKELSQAIKQETAAAAPEGASEVVLRSPYLPTPYRLHQVETWRLDAKRLKATEPVTYARWATKSVSWRLDAVK